MKQIKNILNWIVGMSINTICDFLIMIIGIFSKEVRKMYIKKFYPELSNNESEEECQ